MNRRRTTVSIPNWAALVGLADDPRSVAAARALIAKGEGPELVPIRRRRRTDHGVRLRDHKQWALKSEWAKFLVAEAAKNRRK
jgi:hypothetical protein